LFFKELKKGGMMSKVDEQIELRSEEANEVMHTPPPLIIRSGSLLMALTVVLLIGVSVVVRYPDVVRASVNVVPKAFPVELIAKKSGRIRYLEVREGGVVKEGLDLAVIQSEVNYEDFVNVERQLYVFLEYVNESYLPPFRFEDDLRLGGLQVAFSAFGKAYQEYVFYQSSPFLLQEKKALVDELDVLLKLQKQAKKERSILEKSVSIVEKQYLRDKKLNESQVHSAQELENSERLLLQERYRSENLESSYLRYSVEVAKIERSIQELEKESAWRRHQLFVQLKSAAEHLKGELETWREDYIFRAEVGGKVSMSKYWTENQFIKLGDVVLTVSPLEKALIGVVFVDAKGFGKVAVGQRVQLCLYAFDCREYGKVEGVVESIGDVPIDGRYRVQVSVSSPMRTNYGEILPSVSSQLQGDAYILTDDERLIEKIFYQLRYVFRNVLSN
jgi:HlyD family secretion protein